MWPGSSSLNSTAYPEVFLHMVWNPELRAANLAETNRLLINLFIIYILDYVGLYWIISAYIGVPKYR